MRLIFNFSLKVEQVLTWNQTNVLNYEKKDNKILITFHV